jgi:hypothetical protein
MLEYDEQYITFEDKWAVDLKQVNFITLKQNWEDNNYHIKLHIGTKDVRIVLTTKKELETLTEYWKNINK